MAGASVIGSVTDADENSHFPPAGADVSWQESWAFAWFDPITGVGGAQHIGIERVRGLANATSWITLNGERVHRYQKYDLPVPAEDYSDIPIGPLRVTTLKPFKSHKVIIAHAGCLAELDCVTTLEPTAFSYAVAHGHWELYGRTTGLVRLADGRAFDVDAHCFLDRSWGPRDLKDLAANRYFWAMFGDDLVFKLIRLRMGDGSVVHSGIVVRDGVQIGVKHVKAQTVMDDDGLYPLGADVTFQLQDGTNHRLAVHCDGGDLSPQRNGHKSAWINATFEYGGRVGTGFMAAQELDRLPPWDTELLEMTASLRG